MARRTGVFVEYRRTVHFRRLRTVSRHPMDQYPLFLQLFLSCCLTRTVILSLLFKVSSTDGGLLFVVVVIIISQTNVTDNTQPSETKRLFNRLKKEKRRKEHEKVPSSFRMEHAGGSGVAGGESELNRHPLHVHIRGLALSLHYLGGVKRTATIFRSKIRSIRSLSFTGFV